MEMEMEMKYSRIEFAWFSFRVDFWCAVWKMKSWSKSKFWKLCVTMPVNTAPFSKEDKILIGLKDKKLIKSKRTLKLKHANFILNYFEIYRFKVCAFLRHSVVKLMQWLQKDWTKFQIISCTVADVGLPTTLMSCRRRVLIKRATR